MGIIACIISCIFMVLTFISHRKKKSISPIVFFFALWTFILFLSVLNLYKIIKPSNEAYFLIILMLTFFYGGYKLNEVTKYKKINICDKFYICKKISRCKKNIYEKFNIDKKIFDIFRKSDKQEIKPIFKLFYALSAAIIIFYIIDIVLIIKELVEGTPMWQIRNWTLEPYGSKNPILGRRNFLEEFFRSIVLTPFATIIPPITAYYFLNSNNNRQRYKMLVNSAVILILSSIAGGGGRLGFIYYFGCFLLSFFIIYKNKKISKDIINKYKKIVGIILVVGILFMVAYTIFRTGIGNLVKQVYTYFALPPTLLSIWLPDIKNISHTFGLTSFFGIHSYFFRVLDTMGLDFLVPSIYNDIYSYITNAEIFLNVGYGVGNAFVTPIYYFFIDGGYPFVCIASLLFGYIVTKLYDNFEKNIDIRTFTIYSLIMYGIFLTFMRIQTAIPSYIISFILIFVILRPMSIKIKKDEESEIDDTNIINEDELISVIVPIYKVEKYIKNCIDSIINQTYTNLEIILVDDGSPDNCGKICDEYAKADKRIKVVHKENGGVSSARNVGLDNSNGKYITFIDADDYVSEDYCVELLCALKKENADCVACGYNRIYGNASEKITAENSYLLDNKSFLGEILFVQSGLGFCHMKLWKKESISDTRFDMNLKVGEDALFNMKVSKNINRFYMINKALYNYRFNDTSVVRRYDSDYVEKYLKSMKVAKAYIKEDYKDNDVVLKRLNNYIVYHVLLIIINYCFNPNNNLSFINKMKQIEEVCKVEEFNEAIQNSNYDGFSITRKITLFTIKNKLYFLTAIIGKIRQLQFEMNKEKTENNE